MNHNTTNPYRNAVGEEHYWSPRLTVVGEKLRKKHWNINDHAKPRLRLIVLRIPRFKKQLQPAGSDLTSAIAKGGALSGKQSF